MRWASGETTIGGAGGWGEREREREKGRYCPDRMGRDWGERKERRERERESARARRAVVLWSAGAVRDFAAFAFRSFCPITSRPAEQTS